MQSHDQSSFPCLRLLLAAVLGLALPVRSVHGAETPAAAAAYTPEQQTALTALDKVVASYATLAEQDPDPQHKAAAMALLAGFKERSDGVHSAYDQGRYDELRVDLNLEYQRLASWVARPRILPAPPQAAVRPVEMSVYKLNPAPANKAEVKAALEALDREFRRLEARVEAIPPGPPRDAARQQFNASKQRRAELDKDFTKSRWTALINDLKAQSEKLPP